jgi:hypothetical protein
MTSFDNAFLLLELAFDLREQQLLDGDRQPFDSGLLEQDAQRDLHVERRAQTVDDLRQELQIAAIVSSE